MIRDVSGIRLFSVISFSKDVWGYSRILKAIIIKIGVSSVRKIESEVVMLEVKAFFSWDWSWNSLIKLSMVI